MHRYKIFIQKLQNVINICKYFPFELPKWMDVQNYQSFLNINNYLIINFVLYYF
jgi:hypothetical protein